jgi:hypothetical protein
MPEISEELNVSELDDVYLKVLLLLSVRRAEGAEPRRGGFWHALAGVLSVEEENRQAAKQPRNSEASMQPDEAAELQAILDDLRRDVASIEADYQESYGELKGPVRGTNDGGL